MLRQSVMSYDSLFVVPLIRDSHQIDLLQIVRLMNSES